MATWTCDKRPTALAVMAAALAIGLLMFSCPTYGQTLTVPDPTSVVVAQAASAPRAAADDRSLVARMLGELDDR